MQGGGSRAGRHAAATLPPLCPPTPACLHLSLQACRLHSRPTQDLSTQTVADAEERRSLGNSSASGSRRKRAQSEAPPCAPALEPCGGLCCDSRAARWCTRVRLVPASGHSQLTTQLGFRTCTARLGPAPGCTRLEHAAAALTGPPACGLGSFTAAARPTARSATATADALPLPPSLPPSLRLLEVTWIFVAATLASVFVAYGIGANDVANSFGTSVGAGALSSENDCCCRLVGVGRGRVQLAECLLLLPWCRCM